MASRLPKGYRPSEDEPFMGKRQREFFRRKLVGWRSKLLRESTLTLDELKESENNQPDCADRASVETGRFLELRTRDRERKLISKIDSALERLAGKTYGYCEETGEPIGLKRLLARPVATMSVEAQERHERREKTHNNQ